MTSVVTAQCHILQNKHSLSISEQEGASLTECQGNSLNNKEGGAGLGSDLSADSESFVASFHKIPQRGCSMTF